MAKTGNNYSILVDVELQTKTVQKQLNEATKNLKISFDTKNAKDNLSDVTDAIDTMGLTFQEANLIMSRSVDIIVSMVDQVYELDSALTE